MSASILPPGHCQSVCADLDLFQRLVQNQSRLQDSLHLAWKVARAPIVHLDHLPAAPQQMGQAALELPVHTPAIAHQKPTLWVPVEFASRLNAYTVICSLLNTHIHRSCAATFQPVSSAVTLGSP